MGYAKISKMIRNRHGVVVSKRSIQRAIDRRFTSNISIVPYRHTTVPSQRRTWF